jgi:O-antigen/teichoic acid export membrane protein
MLRSVAQQLSGSLVCAAISFALMLHLGRVHGADDFGRYAAVLSVAVVALPLIEGGWSPVLYRNAVGVAPGEDGEGPAHATAHALLVCAVLIALAAVSAHGLGWAAPATAAAALLCMGAVALSNLVSARMRGFGRFGLESGWRVAGRIASALAIVVALAFARGSIALIFVAWSVGLLLVLATAWRSWVVAPRWRGLRREYRAVLPLLLLELFFALLLKGDVAIAAAAGLDRSALSYYAACGRLAETGLLVFAPFAIVLLRDLGLNRDDRAAYARHLRRALALALALGAAAWLLGLVAGTPLMRLLFGAEFERAGELLPWVLASLPLVFANQIWMQGVVALRGERALPARLAGAAVVCCIAIALGTRLDGARGAALGLLASQVLLALLLAPLARAR